MVTLTVFSSTLVGDPISYVILNSIVPGPDGS